MKSKKKVKIKRINEKIVETYMYGTTYGTKHIKAVIRVRKKQYNVSNHMDYEKAQNMPEI